MQKQGNIKTKLQTSLKHHIDLKKNIKKTFCFTYNLGHMFFLNKQLVWKSHKVFKTFMQNLCVLNDFVLWFLFECFVKCS